jgi:hypothetical protein
MNILYFNVVLLGIANTGSASKRDSWLVVLQLVPILMQRANKK